VKNTVSEFLREAPHVMLEREETAKHINSMAWWEVFKGFKVMFGVKIDKEVLETSRDLIMETMAKLHIPQDLIAFACKVTQTDVSRRLNA